MRWQLVLEEYGPELIYVKGATNIVSDAFSRLTTTLTDDIVEQNFVIICDTTSGTVKWFAY